MKEITNYKNILENSIELLKKEKSLNQSLGYLDSGAKIYYKIDAANLIPPLKDKKNVYTSFILESLFPKDSDIYNFISLGCGNTKRENNSLSFIKEKSKNIRYIGVDTSMEMLKLADKELSSIGIEYNLILGDITSPNLREELKNITKKDDINIFIFLGSTFGNFEFDTALTFLDNLISSNDYLWVDVDIRIEKNEFYDNKLKDFFSNYIHENNSKVLKLNALNSIGIDPKDGDIYLDIKEDDSIGLLSFFSKFKLNKNIKLKENDLELQNNSSIVLQRYNIYYPVDLIKAFDKRNFQYINHNIFNDEVGQFLFKKK